MIELSNDRIIKPIVSKILEKRLKKCTGIDSLVVQVNDLDAQELLSDHKLHIDMKVHFVLDENDILKLVIK